MPEPYYQDEQVTLHHGDCREFTELSADAIITDPPYVADQLHCWDALRDVAIQSLAAGGWLASYSGEAHLPDVFARMAHVDLAYRWTMAVAYEGGGDAINRDDMSVLCEWKPVLLYRRRPFGTARGPRGHWQKGERTRFRDLIRRGGREKDLHPWAQPISEAAQLIETFSRPGEVVLDPFAGSGTTLAAARLLGRRSVGVEIDESWCEATAKRLAQGVLEEATTA